MHPSLLETMELHAKKTVIVCTIYVSMVHVWHLAELVQPMYLVHHALATARANSLICLEMLCLLARSWIPLVRPFVIVKVVMDALIVPWDLNNSLQDRQLVLACAQH